MVGTSFPAELRPGDAMGIALRVDSPERLFEPLDPAPVAKRRLGRDVERYIREGFAQAPREAVLEIHVELGRADRSEGAEVEAAIQHHFSAAADATKRHLREHLLLGARQMAIGMALIAVLITVARILVALSHWGVLEAIADGIVIVIWVILWRPTEMLLFDWWAIRDERDLLARLAKARVRLKVVETRGK